MIHQIPGPLFLLIYAAVVGLGVLVGRKWIDADGTTRHPLPDFTRHDAITLSFLTGGLDRVTKTAVFALMQKGSVTVSSENRETLLKTHGTGSNLSGLERKLFDFISAGRRPFELFTNEELKAALDRRLTNVRTALERGHIHRSDSAILKGQIKKAILLSLILGLGLTKLYLGLTFGRPVAFLIVLLVIAAFVLFTFVKVGKVSKLGNLYLQELERHFSWMRNDPRRGKQRQEYDPLMVLAVLGALPLSLLPDYQPFAQAFPTQPGTTSSTGSSTDNSSTSSGCGGGGCSSGGCGGGGCGGCGG